MQDAGLDGRMSDTDKLHAGVCIGSGIGSLQDTYETALVFHEQGPRRVSPMFVPKILANMAAGHVSMLYGLRGPNHAASTACATGAHAIGDAARFISYGDADVMLAGGTESPLHPLAVAGFAKWGCGSVCANVWQSKELGCRLEHGPRAGVAAV